MNRQELINALSAQADSLREKVFLAREHGEDEMRLAQGLLSEVRDLLAKAAKKVTN